MFSPHTGVVSKHGYGAARMHDLLQSRELGSTWLYSGLQKELQGHGSLANRLKCESVLDGHDGCVNSISWNSNGTLLASGSDDCKVVVWDYLTKQAKLSINSGHRSNIFAVAFVAGTNDQVIASGAMDCDVRLHFPPYTNSKVYKYHRGRVKDVRSTPQVPHVFWSAGEDAKIIQFDLRDLPESQEETVPMLSAETARSNSSSGVLIDLGETASGSPCRAMAMAIHPLDPNTMAFACGDEYIRIYDRRMLQYCDTDKRTKPVALYTPPHLRQTHRRPERHGTSVQYNCDGTEILVSYHSDHIYLLNAREMECNPEGTTPSMTFNYPYRCRDEQIDLNLVKAKGNEYYEKKSFSNAIEVYTKGIELGEAQEGPTDAPLLISLYCNRASALLKRRWRGDVYLAIGDATQALRLDPTCRKAMYRRVKGLKLFGWNVKAKRAANEYKTLFPEHVEDMDRLLNIRPYSSVDGNQDSSEEEDDSTQEEKEESEDEDDLVDGSSGLEELVRTSVLRRYIGYCNIQTDIKEARFFGGNDTHIVAGSDSGHAFIWEKHTGKLVNAVEADADIVNCVQCHPFDAVLATSGIENVVRLWSPTGDGPKISSDEIPAIAENNQERMKQDMMGLMPQLDENLVRFIIAQQALGRDAPQQCTPS